MSNGGNRIKENFITRFTLLHCKKSFTIIMIVVDPSQSAKCKTYEIRAHTSTISCALQEKAFNTMEETSYAFCVVDTFFLVYLGDTTINQKPLYIFSSSRLESIINM
ncbi:hypothetical protein KP509_19G047900 [Ceratopteris richardii]|uniref:Uncharacterized protein n=1 Tax=Ceratopteris richardii TaxID=49495 RepID=A0A8T2SKW1_CERRI|nr:hypothetical protein KP509_19G047900 [Ceratopteris richardii]